jgi:hypothetical protein
MFIPLILTGYIVVTPKFLRVLKELKRSGKSVEEFTVNLEKEAKARIDSEAVKRAVSVVDWNKAESDFKKLLREVRNRNLTRYRSVEAGPTSSDLDRMTGIWFPEDILIKDDDFEEHERLVINNRIFRPRHPQDMIAYGQYINECINIDNTYDGLEFDTAGGEAWIRLYIDWFRMLGNDKVEAEELVYGGYKPWIDMSIQSAEL